MKQEDISKKVKSCINEYLRLDDTKEFQISLADVPPIYYCYLLDEIVSKMLDSNKQSEQEKLVKIIEMDFIAKVLVSNKAKALEVLSSIESIKQVVDMVIDCKEAPERIASFLAGVVKIKVCSSANIATMIEGFKKFNIDEGLNDVKDIEDAFGRLLSSFTSR